MKVFKLLLLLSIGLLAGCGHYTYTVSGGNSQAFQAPTLCGALTACLASSESSCYYDSTTMLSLDGKTIEQNTCKRVTK